jgi:hypothetical protein
MKIYFDDDEMDAQLGRTIIAANAASADIGEALATAARITPGDYGSWFDEWSATARRSQDRAEVALAAGHAVTARLALLRATEYWRQAIFFVRHDLDDVRLQEGWAGHRAAFRRAVPLLGHEVIQGEVGLDGASMAAYLFRSPTPGASAAGRPVVLAPCGYDSTAEAGYSANAYMALRHGYDCLVWEGPGQGGMLYDQRVPMRPDFEAVLTPVVDWLVRQPEVDPGRLAMFGRLRGLPCSARGERRAPHLGVGVRPWPVRLRVAPGGPHVRRGHLAAHPRRRPQDRRRHAGPARRPAPAGVDGGSHDHHGCHRAHVGRRLPAHAAVIHARGAHRLHHLPGPRDRGRGRLRVAEHGSSTLTNARRFLRFAAGGAGGHCEA